MNRPRITKSDSPSSTKTSQPSVTSTPMGMIPNHPRTAAEVIQLQKLYGNRAVARHLSQSNIGTAPVQRLFGKKDKTQTDSATLITEPYVNGLLAEFRSKLTKKVLYQLGGSRAYLRRDKGGRAMRETLKSKARARAAEDISTKIETDQATSGKTKAEKDYIGMKAQGKAYKAAKDATQGTIEEYAHKIVMDAVELTDLTAQIRDYVEGLHPIGGETHLLAATAQRYLEAFKQDIEDRAMTAVQSTQQAVTTGQDHELAQGVEQTVTTERVGETAVAKAVDAPNINVFFRSISRIMDMEVPNVGDKCKITVSGKVWVPETPFYFMATFISDIKRDKLIKVRGEAMLGVGVGAKLWDLNVQAGVYSEVNAEDSIKAMELFSYGVYRGLKSKGLERFPNYAWSEGGKTVKLNQAGKAIGKYTKEEEAEMWAAMVEQSALSNDDAYAEVGWLAKAKATGGDDKLAKGEAEGMFANARRYSKKTMGKDGTGANLAGKANKSSDELKQANKGESRRQLQGQVKLSSDWFGQAGAKIKATYIYDRAKKEYEWKELEVEVEGHLGGVAKNIATGSEEQILAMVFAGIQAFFIPGGAIHRFTATDGSIKKDGTEVPGKSSSKGKTATEDRARTAGNILHLGTDVVPLVAVGANAISEGAAKTIFGGIVGQRTHIGVNFKFVAKKADPKWAKTWELSFFLGKLTKVKVGEALAAEFKTDIETSHRLFMLKSDGSKQFS
jgi:hypothetical protein